MVKYLSWKAELYLYPATLSLSISFVFLLQLFFSLFASPDCSVLSPLYSREIWLTCRGLKGICSAHQVCIMWLFLWTAPPKIVKQAEKYIDLLQNAHSQCYSCYSHETQPGSSLVMRVFHISGYWIQQADYPSGQFVVPLVLLDK